MQPELSVLRQTDIAEAVQIFLEAFEVDETSRAEHAEAFWRLIYTTGIAQFTAARRDRMIIGCGALIRYPRHAWIAFMAVKPRLRGKGIGRAIMDRLMAEASSLGINTLRLDATNWGKPLYLNCGFEDEYRVLMYELLPTVSADRLGPMDVDISTTLHKWCLEMDREAFGDDRSKLLRQVVTRGGKVLTAGKVGYGILWDEKIGPIIAEDLEAATAIVKQARVLGAKHVYVPLHPKLPRRFIAGLREIKPRTSIRCCDRMVFGDRLSERSDLVFASFTAATG
jgi:GNAT superfamily N-acetyltransferase